MSSSDIIYGLGVQIRKIDTAGPCLDVMPLEKVFSCLVSLLSLIMTVAVQRATCIQKNHHNCISDTVF